MLLAFHACQAFLVLRGSVQHWFALGTSKETSPAVSLNPVSSVSAAGFRVQACLSGTGSGSEVTCTSFGSSGWLKGVRAGISC